MNLPRDRVLLLCFGNPSRLDDALGARFANELERQNLPGVTVQVDYQLTLEDALLVAEHDLIVFVDASVDGREPFFFVPIRARVDLSFTTHSVTPECLLGLAQELFDAHVGAYKLGIRGYVFDGFGEALSAPANRNLNEAVQFLLSLLSGSSFGKSAQAAIQAPLIN